MLILFGIFESSKLRMFQISVLIFTFKRCFRFYGTSWVQAYMHSRDTYHDSYVHQLLRFRDIRKDLIHIIYNQINLRIDLASNFYELISLTKIKSSNFVKKSHYLKNFTIYLHIFTQLHCKSLRYS